MTCIKCNHESHKWECREVIGYANDRDYCGCIPEPARVAPDTDALPFRYELEEAAEKFVEAHLHDKENYTCAELMAAFAHTVANERLGWVPIRTVNDLPKADGVYLFQYRLPSQHPHTCQFFSIGLSTDTAWYAATYEAWMPIPPYQQPNDGGETE